MNELTTPPFRPSPVLFGEDGLRAGWSIVLFLVLFLGIGFPLQYAVARVAHLPFGSEARAEMAKNLDRTPIQLIPSEAAGCFTVLVATFLMGLIERRPLAAYGFARTRRTPHLLQGAAWGLACLSLLVGTLTLGHLLRFQSVILRLLPAIHSSLVWALGFAAVAGLEEFLLRGYLLVTLARGLAGIVGALSATRYRRALGFWSAALILSFVFGFGHSSNPGESSIGVVAAGLFGLVLCFSIYRTGSLWWAFGFHTAWDWAQSFLYGVPDSGAMFEGHLFATHPVGPPILSGGLTGPEGSIFILPTLALVAAVIILTLPRRDYSDRP